MNYTDMRVHALIVAVCALCYSPVVYTELADKLPDCSTNGFPINFQKSSGMFNITNTALKCRWIIKSPWSAFETGVALYIYKSYFIGDLKVYKRNSENGNITDALLVKDYLYHIRNDTYLKSTHGFIIEANLTIPNYGILKFGYFSYISTSSEFVCNHGIGTFGGEKFFCQTSDMCIPRERRCDGTMHCHGNEDEIHCNKPTVVPCTTWQRRCSNGRCVGFSDSCSNNVKPTPTLPDEGSRASRSRGSSSGFSIGLSIGLVAFISVGICICRFMRQRNGMKFHCRSGVQGSVPQIGAPPPNVVSGYVPSGHDNQAFQSQYGGGFNTAYGLPPPQGPLPAASAPPSYEVSNTDTSPPSYNDAMASVPNK